MHEQVEMSQDHEMQTHQSSNPNVIIESKSEVGEELLSLKPSLQIAAAPDKEPEDVMMTDQITTEEHFRGQSSDDSRDSKLISPRMLRSADKKQKKPAKNQQPNDHGANAISVEETPVENAEARLQSCQSELKVAQDKLATSRKSLNKTRAQLRGKKRALALSKQKFVNSNGVVRDLKSKQKHLQDCLKTAEGDLTKCKDKIFSLQRVTQVTDSAILKLFDRLGQQVVQWIDRKVTDYEQAHPEAEPEAIFAVGEDKRAKKFLQLYPEAGEHLARYLIHHFLHDNVLGKKIYFLGLPEETACLLRKAEHEMAKLDPPRDSVAIASWRSETLSAISKTEDCLEHGNKQAHDLNSRLFRELSKALPFVFFSKEAHVTFFEQVLVPAIQLASEIRKSSSEYAFSMPESPTTIFKPCTIDLLEVHKMVDSMSGKQVKPDSAVVANEDGVIGKCMICLEPSFSRVNDGKETTLRQDTFLVKLDQPMGKRIKASA